ncbi:MAG: DNRLRE domain-containing protein, partial [bacterium]
GYDDDPQDVVAHRITQEWVEGDGWDLFADGRDEGVTWTTARPGVNWATPGGDFDLAELDRVTVAANPDGWYRWNVTSAVQAWVDGTASNYGLLLEPDNAPWAHHEFRASEYSIPNLRPRLVVNYTVGGVATATPTSTSTPSPTSTPGEPPIRWIYLPLILKGWAAPTPTPTPTSTTVVPPGLIRPSDLVYQGAFAYPSGGEWAYSGHALAYYPEGDPTGPADGYPGSLYAAGHAWYDLVGEITIPAPVIADDFDDLPKASVLQSLTDITGGWKDNCTYTDDCIYREVDGLEYLPNINKIAWNLRDWYNVTGYDQDSLGWSELDMIGAQGVWHIGERPSDGNIFHNAKTCDYLFKAPESFASQYLEGKWLVAGNHRAAGAFGGSQGPTLYALAPWEDGNPPESGQNLDALALLYYPEIYPGCLDNPDECYFPNYRPADDWGGGAWVQTADKSGILIFGRKGLGDNCYGTPEECGGDPCVPSKGYHAYPYEPQILFYDPGELREVMAGTREPWEVMPYAVYRPLNEVFDWECAILGAVAYDWERGLMYVTEQEAGPWGETAVHVWRVEG